MWRGYNLVVQNEQSPRTRAVHLSNERCERGDSRLGDFSTMPDLAYRSPPFVGEHACRRVVAESERLRYVTVSTLSNPTLHRSHPPPPHTPPADPLASPHEAGRRLPDLVRRPGNGSRRPASWG